MKNRAAALEGELAAYGPWELSEFASTVAVLLEAADDGTLEYCAVHARIMTTLAVATENRMVEERKAGATATVIPFPGATDG